MTPLFHYCSVSVFHAIITTGRVRLASVRHSNDHTEGTLLSAAVSRLARRQQHTEEEIAKLQVRATELETQFDGLALCMSEEGDLLSQWRGYADDGFGVAIGFSRPYLSSLDELSGPNDQNFALKLYKANYRPEDHDEAIEPLFRSFVTLGAKPAVADFGDERIQEVSRKIETFEALRLSLQAYDHVFSLKHNAFSEECEWRLLCHIDWEQDTPAGFHPARGRLAPYIELALSQRGYAPISEIVLGSQHTTPPDVVTQFLRLCGYEGVVVRSSKVPYGRTA